MKVPVKWLKEYVKTDLPVAELAERLKKAGIKVKVLPPEAPVGKPPADDVNGDILDLEIPPERPDLLSVIGTAREAATLTEQTVSAPNSGTTCYLKLRGDIQNGVAVS